MRNLTKLALIIFVTAVGGCGKNENINLGGNYRVTTSASFGERIIVNENNIVKVHGHILDFAYNSAFIIAAQRPRDSVAGIKTMTYKESKEAFDASSFRQYWIIDKKNQSIYGPLKKVKFDLLLDSMRITISLR